MTTVKGHMGSVTFDGAAVHLEKKMRGTQVIPLQSIGAVSILPAGIGMRAIRFSVAGGSIGTGGLPAGTHKDLANDPNALTFKKKSLPEFEAFAAEVQAALAAR